MSWDNYPPGVTGNEPEIAGWDELEHTCAGCGAEGVAYGSRRQDYFTFECEECGYFEELAGLHEPDEDYGRDR